MSTLTDRYVWGVVRAVPAAQRADLEPEIRAMVMDAVEARTAAGVVPAEAERAAIAELGDPERLAATYTDRSLFLIGPRFFPDWKRLLAVILPIVLPIVAIALVGAQLIAGTSIIEAVVGGLSTAFTVGVMITFWITVVFAIMEHKEIPDFEEELVWTPDRLPEVPAGTAVSRVETAFSVAFLAIAASALVWQQAARPIVIEGDSFALFNPDLWSFWLPWFIGLLALEMVFNIALYLRGGWTWLLAVANAALGLAFAVPAIWLWSEGRLFDPGLAPAFADLGLNEAMRPAGTVIAVLVGAGTAWDVIDGFLKAARVTWPQRTLTRSR